MLSVAVVAPLSHGAGRSGAVSTASMGDLPQNFEYLADLTRMSRPSIRVSRGRRSDRLDDSLAAVLDATVGALDAAIIVADGEGRVDLWNGGAEELYGWSAEEAVGLFARDLIVPAEDRDLASAVRASLAHDGEWQGWFRCRRRDGSIIVVKVVNIVVPADDGSVRAMVSVARDLTDELAADRGAKALQALADASPDAVLTVAGETIMSWSPAAQRLLGWSADEAVGQSVYLVIPPEHAEECSAVVAMVARGEAISGYETDRVAKDGSLVPVSLDVAPVFDAARHEWLGVVTMRDCRNRDVVIEAALTAEARLRSMMTNSEEVVVVVGADRTIRAVGPSGAGLIGGTSTQLIGSSVVRFVHRDDRGAVDAALDQVLADPAGTAQVLYRCPDRGGEWRWVEATMTNLMHDPAITGVLVNVVDVHEREQARSRLVERETLYRSLFESAADVAMVVDPSGVIREITPSCSRVLGKQPSSLVGRSLASAVSVELGEMLDRNATPNDRELVTMRLALDEHDVIWIDAEVRNLAGESDLDGYVVNLRDVTARMIAAQELHASQSRLSAIVNRSSDVAMFFAADGTICWVSPAVSEVFGVGPEALVGSKGPDLIHEDDRDHVIATFAGGLGSIGDHVIVEFRVPDPNGGVLWLEGVATDLLDDPEVGYIVANVRDITDRKEADAELARLALIDEMTGLPNRLALLELIREGLAERAGDRSTSCGVVFFDIDDFCDVNDSLGHGIGDALLVAMADRLAALMPEGCTLARFGDDQFAVFCRDVDTDAAMAVACLVQRGLEEPFLVDVHEVFVVVSVGVALTPPGDVDSLLRRADTALYRAKKSGRGQTVFFERELATESRKRLHYAGELRRGIERREIRPFYQPVVDLATGRVVAVEALARWHHPVDGFIPPDVFIPAAEATGLIAELGRQILEQSCHDATMWADAGRPLQIAVNASAVQLMDTTFPAQVAAALAGSGLPPEQLTFEITETAAMREMTVVLETLGRLRGIGCDLSLDDFGTGYSSLSLLKRLPVQALKIDRSFVMGLGRSDDDERIVTGVVSLALVLGFRVVAEGVETSVQMNALRSLGCQLGQGYLWSPAVPAHDLLATIAGIERFA